MMKNAKRIAAAAALSMCLAFSAGSPVTAGIIGNDSMNTSQVSGVSFDSGVWKVAYSVSPRFANLLIKLSLI